MVSGSLALLYFLLGFHGGRQGSGPDRGQSPVEWGDFPSVCLSVHPPSEAWLAGWLGLRPGWLGLRPGWLDLRPAGLAKKPENLKKPGKARVFSKSPGFSLGFFK